LFLDQFWTSCTPLSLADGASGLPPVSKLLRQAARLQPGPISNLRGTLGSAPFGLGWRGAYHVRYASNLRLTAPNHGIAPG